MMIDKLKNDLLEDLSHYYKGDTSKLSIDFSDQCGEGHVLHFSEEVSVESASGIIISDASGNRIVTDGWFDFVKDAETNEVFYFWLFLTGPGIVGSNEPLIPDHVWNRLSTSSKNMLSTNSYNDTDVRIYESKINEQKEPAEKN
jgi:hypothetical protein